MAVFVRVPGWDGFIVTKRYFYKEGAGLSTANAFRPDMSVCLVCGRWKDTPARGRIPTTCSTTCRKRYQREGARIMLPAMPPPVVKVATEADKDATSAAVSLHKLGEFEEMLRLVSSHSIRVGECWEWPDIGSSGYSAGSLYRRVLEAKEGAPLGSQAAHHKCANTKCVNPEHLQPVTHRENTAEMLARKSLVSRVRELEAELARLDPGNDLLDRVPVI